MYKVLYIRHDYVHESYSLPFDKQLNCDSVKVSEYNHPIRPKFAIVLESQEIEAAKDDLSLEVHTCPFSICCTLTLLWSL